MLTGYTGRYKAVLRRAVLRIEEEVMVVELDSRESALQVKQVKEEIRQ